MPKTSNSVSSKTARTNAPVSRGEKLKEIKGVNIILCHTDRQPDPQLNTQDIKSEVVFYHQIIPPNPEKISEMMQRYFAKFFDPQITREAENFCKKQLVEKEGCYLFTRMDDKICGVEYTTIVSDKCSRHTKEAGSYDTNDANSKPKLTSGSRVVTDSIKMEDQQNCVTREVYEVNNPAEKPTEFLQ